jgi:hypothetical protein
MIFGADATSPIISIGGGTLLATCIGFTIALFRIYRRRDRDLSVERKEERASREDAERGLSDMIKEHRADVDKAVAVTEARYQATTEQLNRRLELTEKRERICNKKVDLLITACQQGGVPVPPQIWSLDE